MLPRTDLTEQRQQTAGVHHSLRSGGVLFRVTGRDQRSYHLRRHKEGDGEGVSARLYGVFGAARCVLKSYRTHKHVNLLGGNEKLSYVLCR